MDIDLTKGIPRECISCDGPNCDHRGPEKRCSRCRTQYYCSVACQRAHWRDHKPYCIPLEVMRAKFHEEEPPLDKSLLLQTESLDPEKECPICLLHPIQNPVTLKACRHSFCTKCLIEWQKQAHAFSGEVAPCPLCRSNSEDIEKMLMEQAALLAGEANMRTSLSKEETNNLRKDAIALLDRLFENPSVHLQAYFMKANLLIELGDGDEALRVIQDMLLENEKRANHPVLKMISEQEAAEQRGDQAESERLQNACIEYYEKHGGPPTRLAAKSMFDIHVVHSMAYQIKEDWNNAIKKLVDAMMLLSGPDDVSPIELRKLHMSMARCAYKAGSYKKSIAVSDAAIEMNRHFDKVHRYKALSFKKLGKLHEAVETMNQAVLYETPWSTENLEKALELYQELVAERDASASS